MQKKLEALKYLFLGGRRLDKEVADFLMLELTNQTVQREADDSVSKYEDDYLINTDEGPKTVRITSVPDGAERPRVVDIRFVD